MDNSTIIRLNSITKVFSSGSSEFTALKDISLDFKKGEFTGLVGPSGSGKTTLLNIIGSLDNATSGYGEVAGKDISKLSGKQSAELRNYHIGFIFQTYNLLPVYTVYENVEFTLLLQNHNTTDRKKAVMDALDWVGLTDKVNSKPAQLSGGESQRVAIARAIVKKPEIVLADEPSANLDAKNTHHIMQTMKKINEELKTTFIFATHDEKVMQYLDRMVYLKDGIVERDEIVTHIKI